MENS
jgi:hypothetical protein